MADDFVKLFCTEQHGQILVMLKENDDGNPGLFFYCQPDPLGLCHISVCMDDSTDASWERARTAFERVAEEDAIKGVAPIYQMIADAEGTF